WVQNGTAPGLSEQTTQVNPYLSFVRANQSFSELAAYMAFFNIGDMNLSVGNDPVRLSGVPVSPNFFPMLGVQPVIGRGFNADESAWNGPKAALISYSLWQQRFGADRSVVGRAVTIN